MRGLGSIHLPIIKAPLSQNQSLSLLPTNPQLRRFLRALTALNCKYSRTGEGRAPIIKYYPRKNVLIENCLKYWSIDPLHQKPSWEVRYVMSGVVGHAKMMISEYHIFLSFKICWEIAWVICTFKIFLGDTHVHLHLRIIDKRIFSAYLFF